MVEKTYKHKPIYLVAKEEGEIKGVLPLFLMRSWFFGKKLVSVPFVPYGYVCGDDSAIGTADVEETKKITKEYLYDVERVKIQIHIHLFKGNDKYLKM